MSPTTSSCGKYTGSTAAGSKLTWITFLSLWCIKKGGFSTTSWPTLIIRSARSIARCTKSPSDSAVLPANRGSLSLSTPLPICVVTNGIQVLSTNSRSILAVSFRLAPAPINSSGEVAFSIMDTAEDTALYSAIGRLATLGSKRCAVVCSAATSSGSSMWTAPGRSWWASRNASLTVEGILSPLTTCVVNLVIGRIMSTISMTWKRPCLLVFIGFWPVIINMGIAPSCA